MNNHSTVKASMSEHSQANPKLPSSGFKVTSPHLLIYRPQLTSIMSISHRITGVVLFGCLWLLALAIVFALWIPDVWQSIYDLIPSWLVGLFVGLLALVSFYHLLNGIRHLCWDYLLGLELKQVYFSGRVVVVLSIVLLVGYVLLLMT